MTMESRKKFIHELATALGSNEVGHQVIANKLGLSSRQGIDNQVRFGFAHKWKPALLALANTYGIEPHPELHEGKRARIARYTTPAGRFILELKKKYGDIITLADHIGCSESTLRRMCESRSHISKRRAEDLVRVANKVDVEVPDFIKEMLHEEGKSDT